MFFNFQMNPLTEFPGALVNGFTSARGDSSGNGYRHHLSVKIWCIGGVIYPFRVLSNRRVFQMLETQTLKIEILELSYLQCPWVGIQICAIHENQFFI